MAPRVCHVDAWRMKAEHRRLLDRTDARIERDREVRDLRRRERSIVEKLENQSRLVHVLAEIRNSREGRRDELIFEIAFRLGHRAGVLALAVIVGR